MIPIKLTAIVPLYNVLSADYPYLECLITYMPLVDKIIINDGGCNDGTIKYIKKLKENVFENIEIIKIEHKVDDNWKSMDDALEQIIHEDDESDWFIEIQADEFINPKDYKKHKDTLQLAHKNNYNGIRQRRINISDWSRISEYEYRIIRFFRNTKNKVIKSKWGGDCFHFENEPQARKGFTTHNLPPEYDTKINLYHLQDAFPKSRLKQLKRHVNRYAVNHPGRKKSWEIEKKRIKARGFKKLKDIELYKDLPELFYGLTDKMEYEVRDELFDKEWLKGKRINI